MGQNNLKIWRLIIPRNIIDIEPKGKVGGLFCALKSEETHRLGYGADHIGNDYVYKEN